MSSSINQALRQKEERDMEIASEEETFNNEAMLRFAECLSKGGDLHGTIEEVCSDYWEIFYTDLEDAEINILIIQASSYLIRNAV